jgi:hypothetical protein
MIFFDFLFYSVYKFYADYEKGAASSSAGIVGGFQAMNILTIIIFCRFAFLQKAYIDKLWGMTLFIVLQITTYYRYIYKDTHSVEVMERKWLAITDQSRKQFNNLHLLYVVLSIIAFFGLIIFIIS